MNDQSHSMQLPELRTVSFHGDEIVTFEAGGKPHVAMRRIVENMGIDWARQASKLQEQQAKFNCVHMPTVGADGKTREMLAMPVDKLPLWLATINPNKIRDAAIRAKVEDYQAESAIALHDYWTKGAAVRGDHDGIVEGITPAVMNEIGGMVKRVLHRQLVEIVPAMVEARLLADPRRAVCDSVSVRQMLDKGGALQRKRNGLNRKFGYELKRRTLNLVGQGQPSPGRQCPHTNVWLYKIDFADAFMRERGEALIADHNAAVMGQGVIPFPRAKKRDQTQPPATL